MNVVKPKELSPVGGSLGFGAPDPKQDVIDGWNWKTTNANTPEIDGLVPFVQLIGLYNEEEINRLVDTDINWQDDARTVVFVENGEEQDLSSVAIEESGYQGQVKTNIAEEQREYFDKELRSKFVGVTVLDETKRDDSVVTPGIILATNASQAGNEAYQYYSGTGIPKDAGGLGISDLQIETGTKDFMNRRYKLRLTVTDPQALNNEPQYLKLTTLQAQFLIIHGWSNPQSMAGWPGDAPPQVEAPTAAWPNGKMLVDLTQQNTGGAWGAAVVALTMFDFAFNEVGQLEASFTFMPREISFLATYRIPVIAESSLRLLGTGEKQEPSNAEDPYSSPSIFAGLSTGLLSVAGEFGKNLADVIAEEQAAYANKNDNIKGLFDLLDDTPANSAIDTLRDWSEQASEWSGNLSALIERQQEQESRYRFPYAGPGIRTYEKIKRSVPDPNYSGESSTDNADSMTTVTEHKTRLSYYYLGWILEAVRFGMWDLNKNKVRRGETPFNVRFRYMPIPPESNSYFNLSFQETLRSGLVPNTSSYVQEAVKKLLSDCFPGLNLYDPMKEEMDCPADLVRSRPMTEWDLNEGWPAAWEKTKSTLSDSFKNIDGSWEFKYFRPEQLGRYAIIGRLGEGEFAPNVWDTKTREEKIAFIESGDWRRSLVVDPQEGGYLRIMHPDYEYQILYTMRVPVEGWWIRSAGSGDLPTDVADATKPSKKKSAQSGQAHAVALAVLSPNSTAAGRASNVTVETAEHIIGDEWAFLGTSDKRFGEQYSNIQEQTLRTGYSYNQVLAEQAAATPFATAEQKESAAGTMMSPIAYIYSKYNNFFVGDISATPEYGLFSPASSARYYSGEYVALQRRWYNKHREYMSQLFENIIRSRIEVAMEQGQTIADIADEPVDLAWLTGKKYHTSAGADLRRAGVAGGAFPSFDDSWWNGPQSIIQAESTWSVEYIKNEGHKLIVESQQELMSDLDEKIEDAEEVLNTFTASRSNRGNTYLMETSLSQIQYADRNRFGSLNTLFNAEDLRSGALRGAEGISAELEFWKSRLSIVLSELYNNDIISFTTQSQGAGPPNLTHAGQLAPPDGVPSNRGDATIRTMIPDASQIDILSFKNIKIENGYNTPMFDTKSGGYEPVDFDLFFQMADAGGDFQGLYNEGIRRYVVTTFDEENITLNLENINRIGNMGLSEMEMEYDLWPNKSYLQYMFMATMTPIAPVQINNMLNNIPIIYSDRYWSAEALLIAAKNDRGIMQTLTQARHMLWNHIKRQRRLVRRYLEKIQELLETQNSSGVSLQLMRDTLDDLRGRKIILERSLAAFDNEVARGPFETTSPYATPVVLDKGGGRSVELGSLVAQQYEQRFRVREVNGANDIHNYGPPAGGLSYIDPQERNWGWWGDQEFGPIIADAEGVLNPNDSRVAQQNRVRDTEAKANYGDWNAPVSILDVEAMREKLEYEWNGETYLVRHDDINTYTLGGKAPTHGNGVPFGLISESALLNGHVSILPQTKVIDLVRAGFVNTDLIKELLLYRYGWDNIGFMGNAGEYADPSEEDLIFSKIIRGFWPSIIYSDFYDFKNKTAEERVANAVLTPLEYVDQDLDFVGPAYWQAENENTFSVVGHSDYAYLRNAQWETPEDMSTWIKIAHHWGIFAAVGSRQDVLYPSSLGYRIGENRHLSAIPIAATRQLVNIKSRKDITKVAVGGYSNNPDWADVPNEISATENNFDTTGRPRLVDGGVSYPYGAPGVNTGSLTAVRGSFIKGWPDDDVYADRTENMKNSAPTIHSILDSLPPEFERGFLTSTKNANPNFAGGPEMNGPLAEFIYKYLIYLLPQGRRIGHHPNYDADGNSLSQYRRKVRDVTYGDLFDEVMSRMTTMADFTNQTIQNVAEIPIKREVIDNLLNRKNANMSLLNFIQQVMSPNSIGLAGNVQIGARNINGIVELFPATISYKGKVTDIFKNQAIADDNNKPPEDQLSFDYKRKNSLIQSIDMSSKMDPAAFLTYQNSSDLLRGRDYNVLKLLSYEGVAEDFKEFLDGTANVDNAGENYSGVITYGAGNKIKIDKARFDKVPTGIIDSFISQDPERWAKITAMMQGNNNFTTELLAFYMRAVTLTIHGMTNIQPFNLVNVRGVLPALEGVYIVTNLTEKVTPTEFQTILEGKLLKRKRLVPGGRDVFI